MNDYRACSIDGCDSPVRARGWCDTHYSRYRRHGDPLYVTRRGRVRAAPTPCMIDGCKQMSLMRSLCRKHYDRWHKHGDPLHVGKPGRRRQRDLVGERFGSLVVTAPTDGGRGRWECLCDCGNSTTVQSGNLNGGYVTACGDRQVHRRADVVGYSAAHHRIYRDIGKASEFACVDCGDQAHDWSYDHEDPDELIGDNHGIPMPYSLKPEHYDPRCVPCHRTFDLAHGQDQHTLEFT